MDDCFGVEEQNVVEIQPWQQRGAPETEPSERVAPKTAFSETIVLKCEIVEFPSLQSRAAVRFPAKPSPRKAQTAAVEFQEAGPRHGWEKSSGIRKACFCGGWDGTEGARTDSLEECWEVAPFGSCSCSCAKRTAGKTTGNIGGDSDGCHGDDGGVR